MNVRKLLTFILAVSLMLTAIPSPVFAETEVVESNTPAEAVPEAVEDSAPRLVGYSGITGRKC